MSNHLSLTGIAGSIGIAEDPIANEQKILNAGRIPFNALQVSVGVLFGVATVTLTARIITRLYTRRRIYLDDVFLIFSFLSLTAATILLYKFARLLYTNEALKLDSTVVVSFSDVLALMNSLTFIDAFLALAWTTIFFVKFSFLALFRLVIRGVSRKTTIYFWVVVGVCIVTWLFLISEPFILCPHFGVDSIKCLPETPFTLSLALTIFVTILDITADSMIVSIPIIILQKTQMKTAQKLSLSIFLCLSIVMAITALTRIGAYRIHGVLDITWEIFWMWTEACIASIMGSMVAFRTLLVQSGSRILGEKGKEPPYSMPERLLRKMNLSKDSDWDDMDQHGLPQIPSATLTGVRNFVRRNNRSFATSTVMRSESGPMYEGQGEISVLKAMGGKQIYPDDQADISIDRVGPENPHPCVPLQL